MTPRPILALLALSIAFGACGSHGARADSTAVGQPSDAAPLATGAGTTPPPVADTVRKVASLLRARSGQAAAPPATSVAHSGATSDTVRGIIRVVGGAADEQVVVRPNVGGAPLTLRGAQAPTLGRLAGAEVWLVGARGAMRGFTVSRFLVRSVDGTPALDGVVVQRNGAAFLVETGTGAEHRIANPPASLLAHAGARVWIAGPLDGAAVTFGVISDP